MKNSRHAFLVYLVMILAMPASTRAQAYAGEKPLGEIESSMEANLTWNLQNALLLYYPENKFVVKADVKIQPYVPKRSLPKLPDALLSKSLDSLPGLPYLPQDLSEGQTSPSQVTDLRDFVRNNHFQISRIRVNILVDDSLGASDWAFIRRYATLISDLEPSRGDQVRIERLAFPDKASFLSQKSLATPPQQPLQKATEARAAPDPRWAWYPYAFAGLLALFLALAFWLGVRAITRSLRRSPERTQAQPPLTEPAVPEKRLGVHEPRGEKKDENAADEHVELLHLKSELIDTIVGTPGAAAKVFGKWIDEREEDGESDAAKVLAMASKPLIDILAPFLGHETTASLNGKMTLMDGEPPLDEAQALIRQFNEDLRLLTLQNNKEQQGQDALAFLHQMSDNQLEHLLKPLKTGIKAIVLAQLRANRAAKFLSKMNAEEKREVMLAMGSIEHIPLDVYQHIARQLANRANKLDKMRYVRANGVDAMLKVMEYLDAPTQEEILQHIQTRDVKLAEKVNQKFMTFNQLLELPEGEIQRIALEVDRDILAKSLVTVDEESVNKIVQALPEKLRELVVASLESHHDLPEDEVEQARRTLMRTLREKNKVN